ncbi:hypothetical protein ACFLYW_03935 [Thermodesulfobacteriota bacterium]
MSILPKYEVLQFMPPDGRGLSDVSPPALEEAVNICVVNANKGNSIDVNSKEMQEVVSHIKSLGWQPEF